MNKKYGFKCVDMAEPNTKTDIFGVDITRIKRFERLYTGKKHIEVVYIRITPADSRMFCQDYPGIGFNIDDPENAAFQINLYIHCQEEYAERKLLNGTNR